ncbi:hypothetical protein JCM33774_07800 [Actinophytocola sp. KF-1]
MRAAVSAVVVLVVLLVAGDDPDGSGPSFRLTGVFTLTGGVSSDTGRGACEGSGDYDDVRAGTPVTVHSMGGDVLATGALGSPVWAEPVCEFRITVAGVPGGHDFYQVEIGRHGKIAVSYDEARNGQAAITLG